MVACQPGLEQQPKVKTDAESTFFANHSGARPMVEGAVPYLEPGSAKPKLTRELLETGKLRYEIHCSVCHGLTGNGDGMAVSRGFPSPKTFHSDDRRKKSVEDFFRTVTEGEGTMYGFSNTLSAHERWAVSYYVQALQLRAHFPKKYLKAGEFK
jgi:mono/diheme cytochrome c family protein